MTIRYRCRNDFVLIRVKNLGKVHGIAMPDTAIQGKEFIVQGFGSDVKGLKRGDKVLITGSKDGGEFYPLPNDSMLILVHQEFVGIVFDENGEEGDGA